MRYLTQRTDTHEELTCAVGMQTTLLMMTECGDSHRGPWEPVTLSMFAQESLLRVLESRPWHAMPTSSVPLDLSSDINAELSWLSSMKYPEQRVSNQQMLKMYELAESTREVDKVMIPSILIVSFITSAKVLNGTHRDQRWIKPMCTIIECLNSTKTTSTNCMTSDILDILFQWSWTHWEFSVYSTKLTKYLITWSIVEVAQR